jgi:hypothetical protein
MSERDDPFLARWARRKAEARRGAAREPPVGGPAAGPARDAVRPPAVEGAPAMSAAPPPVGPGVGAQADAVRAADAAPSAPAQPALPTLDDVARLTRDSDYAPFVRPGVDPGVKNAALKKLFSDPHFNVMDGLDVYIDDYGQPDPIPASMLRQLNQAVSLGLFAAEEPGERPRRQSPDDAAPDAPAAQPSASEASPGHGAPASAAPEVARPPADPSHDAAVPPAAPAA